MLTKNDIITLTTSKASYEAGLEYALKSWAATFNRMGTSNPYLRIEKIIIGVLVETEFIYWLKNNNIPFNLHGRTKWYEADRYDVQVRNIPADVKSNFLDTNSKHIIDKYNTIVDKGEWFLSCHALVPEDQFNCVSARKLDEKYYIFSFLEGCFNELSHSGYLIHAFWDYTWLKKGDYKTDKSTSRLKITYSAPSPDAKITIYGTSQKKELCVENVILDKKVVITENCFDQVFSIQWKGNIYPEGCLTIRADGRPVERIKPENSFELVKKDTNYTLVKNNWQNVDLLNSKLYLLGWISDKQLRIVGDEVPRFSHNVEQYGDTKVNNWGCLVSELESINTI